MATSPYYPGNWFPQPPVQAGGQLKGRPVTSIEEVKGSVIDFDGSVSYFPDLGNKKIYTKQINTDGTSTINMYELKPIPVSASPYVSRDEFEALKQELGQIVTQVSNFGGQRAAAAPVQSAPNHDDQSPQTSTAASYSF